MKEFGSLAAFALHVGSLDIAVLAEVKKSLRQSAKLIQRTAKSEMGTYQDAIGPFPAWAPLADSTKQERLEHGFTPDEPLLRSHQLCDAITIEVHDLEAAVGVKSQDYVDPITGEILDAGEIMADHEFGRLGLPPRPVLGPAALRCRHAVGKLLERGMVMGIHGHGLVLPAPALGDLSATYDGAEYLSEDVG